MATAEEILAAAGVIDETILIDLDSRELIIPKTILNLGVESDDDTKVLHFSVPRMYKKVDLSTYRVRVNYRNANDDTDIYPVEDATVTDDGMLTFSWTVGRFAYTKKGNERIEIVLDGGECRVGTESTLLDLSAVPYRVLRQGALSRETIAAAL